MSEQQYVILSPDDSPDGSLTPIGSREAVLDQLAVLNTAPEMDEGSVLYGPGIRIELSPGDPITQMLLTLVEPEIAWSVVLRLAKELQWKILDPVTGRELVFRSP